MRLLLTFIFMISCSHQSKWGYYGVHSPDQWGKISSEYQACELGHNQSPVDLSMNNSIEIEERVKFNYHDSKTSLIDNGHTVKAVFKEENYIEISNKKYFLKQLHFHTHSEHSVEGVFYPLELHLVHKASDGKLAVLAFFIDVDNKNTNRFGFFKNIKRGATSETTIKLSRLIRYAGEHFFYNGSLTTPPCTENVHWIVFDKHLSLNRTQVENFRAIYSRNYRHINTHKFKGQIYHSSL